jgi:hypothetical protein
MTLIHAPLLSAISAFTNHETLAAYCNVINPFRLTTTHTLLNWRAFYCAIGAIDATVIWFWLKDFMARLTLVEELTRIRWHGFFFCVTTFWASNNGL